MSDKKVEKNKVVSLEYTLKLESGEVVDESHGEPIVYLHGAGQLIPGLEKGMEGMSIGEERDITVSPEDAYGQIDENAIQEIPRSAFGDNPVEVGMKFYADFGEGHNVPFYVKEVKEESVVVDFNHPLAGETLYFHVKVVDIRDATPDEIEHGHVHG